MTVQKWTISIFVGKRKAVFSLNQTHLAYEPCNGPSLGSAAPLVLATHPQTLNGKKAPAWTFVSAA